MFHNKRMNRFSERLRELRIEKGLSRRQLAEMLDTFSEMKNKKNIRDEKGRVSLPAKERELQEKPPLQPKFS